MKGGKKLSGGQFGSNEENKGIGEGRGFSTILWGSDRKIGQQKEKENKRVTDWCSRCPE